MDSTPPVPSKQAAPMLPPKKKAPTLPQRPASVYIPGNKPLLPSKPAARPILPKKRSTMIPVRGFKNTNFDEDDIEVSTGNSLEFDDQTETPEEATPNEEQQGDEKEEEKEEAVQTEEEPPEKKETIAEKRRKIVGEMQDTEEYYVSCLDIMVNQYLHPLLQLAETELMPARTKFEIQGIFVNIEQILPINKHLQAAITERVSTWGDDSMVGDIFLKMAPFFKMYNEYGNNYEKAVEVLSRCQLDQTFTDAIDRISHAIDSVSLESMLIMPVQRIPRYNLLLRDLLRKTDSQHPDFENLTQALDQFENVMEYLDKNITEAENMKRFLAMSKMKGGNRLIQAHRVLIAEGVLNLKVDSKESVKGKLFSKLGKDTMDSMQQEKLKIWLFNDVLVHLRTSKNAKKTDVASTEYTWPLELVWLKDVDNYEVGKQTVYSFILVGPRKTYTVTFDSLNEKHLWMGKVDDAVKKVLNEQNAPDEFKRYGQYKFPGKEGGLYDGWWKFGRIHGNGVFEFFSNKYTGQWEYNCKSGIGTFECVTGELYEGEWKNDKPHGYGTFSYTDGSKYEGEWRDGVRCGKGMLIYKTGDVYDGEWEDNLLSGEGKYTSTAGWHYLGSWAKGEPHGSGSLRSPNGRTYDGEFNNGAKEGEGAISYANGKMYVGQWRRDKRHGYGVETSKIDGMYAGPWSHDMKEGTRGKLIYTNGNWYDGGWKRGLYHGVGVLRLTYGAMDKFDGHWELGKFQGKGIIFYKNGARFEGYFKDDKLHGQGVYTAKNAVVFEGRWNEGTREGKASISVGPSRYSSTVKNGMMAEGERSFLITPDVPVFHISL